MLVDGDVTIRVGSGGRIRWIVVGKDGETPIDLTTVEEAILRLDDKESGASKTFSTLDAIQKLVIVEPRSVNIGQIDFYPEGSDFDEESAYDLYIDLMTTPVPGGKNYTFRVIAAI